MFKVPLDIGSTCPNRDGTKGIGGCTYCIDGGVGSFPGYGIGSLSDQFYRGVERIRRKWPVGRAIVYFQSASNTYMPPEHLRSRVEEALTFPGVCGVSIATRADVLPSGILDYLEELSRRVWLCVELGLQTVHDNTARRINRCHDYAEFLSGYQALRCRGIRTCVHLMNGLPGESRDDMLQTALQIGRLYPHSVKFHMLYLLRGSAMAAECSGGNFPLLSGEEYISILCEQLELLPPETVIQRITGDPPLEGLIAPCWITNKLWVRNALDLEMSRRDTTQGARFIPG